MLKDTLLIPAVQPEVWRFPDYLLKVYHLQLFAKLRLLNRSGFPAPGKTSVDVAEGTPAIPAEALCDQDPGIAAHQEYELLLQSIPSDRERDAIPGSAGLYPVRFVSKHKDLQHLKAPSPEKMLW